MREWPSPQRHLSSSSPRRIERFFGSMNTFLIAIAIGLSVLDLTCFAGLHMAGRIVSALTITMALPPTQDTATAPDFQ